MVEWNITGANHPIRYDFKCSSCEEIWKAFMTIHKMMEGGHPCPKCESTDTFRYHGNSNVGARTDIKIKDLMETDAFAREHTRPKEWFEQQTEMKRDANDKKQKDRLVREGRLGKINQWRKRHGLSEL
jgi:hypothetical protein